MFVSRSSLLGALVALFGIGLFVVALVPRQVAYHDVVSLLARQTRAPERWQKQIFNATSSVGFTNYDFTPPIGTEIPPIVAAPAPPPKSDDGDITGSITPAADDPDIDRTLKGDRLVPMKQGAVSPPEEQSPEIAGVEAVEVAVNASAPIDAQLLDVLRAPSLPEHAVKPKYGEPLSSEALVVSSLLTENSLGRGDETMEHWKPGEAPQIVDQGRR